jgi:hypothetical protein
MHTTIVKNSIQTYSCTRPTLQGFQDGITTLDFISVRVFLYSLYLEHWFSTGEILFHPKGAFGNAWRHFWLS